MNEHEVNILQAKCVIGLVNESVIVSFASGNDFAGDEDIFTGDYTFSDCFSDSASYTLLVAVIACGVDEPIA